MAMRFGSVEARNSDGAGHPKCRTETAGPDSALVWAVLSFAGLASMHGSETHLSSCPQLLEGPH